MHSDSKNSFYIACEPFNVDHILNNNDSNERNIAEKYSFPNLNLDLNWQAEEAAEFVFYTGSIENNKTKSSV